MNKFFTDTEMNTLQTARKNGGIFLKIYEREQRVECSHFTYETTETRVG